MAALLVEDGIEYVVYWSGGYVKLSIDGATATNAFALAEESGLSIVGYPDGRLCIVYQDSDGDPQRKYSSDGGTTFTDS